MLAILDLLIRIAWFSQSFLIHMQIISLKWYFCVLQKVSSQQWAVNSEQWTVSIINNS